MELLVIVAQLPFLTALTAPSILPAPHAPLDIRVLFAMAASQDTTKVAQPALIAPPSTLIASPAPTVLTATPAKLDTLVPPAIAAHPITTGTALPAPLARPSIATV